jgi:hypothetical protein
VFAPNTSAYLQKTLAAEAHLAGKQFLLDIEESKFFDLPSRNSKASSPQSKRAEFREPR